MLNSAISVIMRRISGLILVERRWESLVVARLEEVKQLVDNSIDGARNEFRSSRGGAGTRGRTKFPLFILQNFFDKF